MLNAWTYFLSDAFLTNPTEAIPSQGFGIVGHAFVAKDVYVNAAVTDANGKVQEVSGDGVVGEQPHLSPGEKFQYSSGAVLETPVGAMQGRYMMETDAGTSFDAPIPPFTLAVPGVLH